MKKVNINIWDDFYDDGYVPAGKTQQTYVYVEEREYDFSEDLQDEIMKFFYEQIKSSKHLEGGYCEISRPHKFRQHYS